MKDQSEFLVANEHLTLQAAFLEATLARLTGETVAAPALSRNDIVADHQALTAHVAMLQQKISSLAVQPLIASNPTPKASEPTRGAPASDISKPASLDERCAQVAADRQAKRKRDSQAAAVILADAKANKSTLDAAIKKTKGQN